MRISAERAGVAVHVGQRFLRDTEQSELHFLWETLEIVRDAKCDARRRCVLRTGVCRIPVPR